MTLPLNGVRIVEFEGIGPGPLAGHMLLGMGADVTLVARPNSGPLARLFSAAPPGEFELAKRRMVLDLKRDADRAQAMDLVAGADALIDAMRPGVMERLGLGPADCSKRNPALVYGRISGWGQSGPLAQAAGHDLNYVALSGLLSLSARSGQAPIVPPTVVGDGAGALGLSFGIVCALLEARATGRGCVVDAAIVDIAAMVGSIAHWLRASGQLDGSGPSPFHDSPFYDVFECSDGRFITIGALEPKFYALLLEKLGLGDVDPRGQYDANQWPALKERFRALFKQRPRDEWRGLLEGTDVCFAPVLTAAEAARHPHNLARGNFVERAGAVYGAIAPRFSPLDDGTSGD
jgi:alpha-methylacyl-CoA racemase